MRLSWRTEKWEPARRRSDASEQGRRRRRPDWRQRVVDGLLVALIVGNAIWVNSVAHSVRSEAGRRAAGRIVDCRRQSRARAADVGLNWIYYQSEVRLARRRPIAPGVLSQLAPGDRTLLAVLLESGQTSRRILEARARADYSAAYFKAQAVDYHDVGLIPLRTPLGTAQPPRRWVLHAHYSCAVLLG